DWIVYGDELCPIGERGFHFDFTNHLRNAFHDLVSGENLPACAHELRDGPFITRSLQDEIADERDAFGIVELDAPRETRPRDRRGERDHQLVLFTRGEMHVSSGSRVSTTTSRELGTGPVQTCLRIARESRARHRASRTTASQRSA